MEEDILGMIRLGLSGDRFQATAPIATYRHRWRPGSKRAALAWFVDLAMKVV